MSQTRFYQEHLFLFKLAVVFLTRLPVKIEQDVDEQALNNASGYFPFVGLLLALMLGAFLAVMMTLVSANIAVALMLTLSLLLTGAFHEDGLADTADGLGGGWTVEQKLNIMKDSRLGTYGASALFSLLLLKFLLLTELAEQSFSLISAALVLGHTVSRAFAVSLIGLLEYVQLDQASKTKPLAKSLSEGSKSLLIYGGLFAIVVSLILFDVTFLFIALLLACLFALRHLIKRFFSHQLGGYTGDLLGAAQQGFELFIYLALVVAYVS